MHLPQDTKGRIKLGLGLLAVVAVYFLYKQFFPHFDPQSVLNDVSGALGKWTYALVTVFAFLETGAFVGLVAPGETVVVVAGAVAGQGTTNVLLTIALVWAGAFCGDTASFLLGRKLGRSWVLEHGERLRITHERFAQVEAYFDRHGGKTILIGRFIGLVRALAPFIAGSSGMRYRAMAPYSILGTGLWATFFTLLGYYAAKNLNAVFNAAERGFFWFAVIVGVIVFVVVAVRWLRVAENRERAVAEMEERAWLRPLLKLGPQVRFVSDRLTPGGLGIELTAPLAALAVGSFVFIAFAIVVSGDPGPTGGDQAAADFVSGIRSGWLTDVEKVITALGSAVVTIPVAIVAAIAFARGGHRTEMWILVVSFTVVVLAAPEAKAIIDRPRPPDSLVSYLGSSYPSGHAAHSILYAWLAIAATLRLRPGWTGGTTLLVSGIVLTALIGLSRVYLSAHYLSDVSGGWGLATSVFAISTVVAVLVGHFRQNRADAS